MRILAAVLCLFSLSAFAVENGNLAPAFALPSASGKTISLTAQKGKVVVLEWLNHGCPFVRKHYDSGNMQKLQKDAVAKGVLWYSIISSKVGAQGYQDAKGALAEAKKYNSAATEILLDVDGTVGRAFEAKVTPHMYVINKEGRLAYQGAIDDKATADQADIKGAKNYVSEAVDATLNGQKILLASTKAYGCGVKY